MEKNIFRIFWVSFLTLSNVSKSQFFQFCKFSVFSLEFQKFSSHRRSEQFWKQFFLESFLKKKIIIYLCRSVTGVKSNDMGYATPPARHKQPRESPALATYNLPRMNKDTRTVQPPEIKNKKQFTNLSNFIFLILCQKKSIIN